MVLQTPMPLHKNRWAHGLQVQELWLNGIMQEAKYVEDIVSAIKQDLTARGFINEHDRLGHFESVVPLDSLFAIARPQNHVKIFALQFKAPHPQSNRIQWHLTHPEHQFHKLASQWHPLIWYCLPHYLTTQESVTPLRHTLFVTAKGMASTERAIIGGTDSLPADWLEVFRSFLLFHDHPDCKRLCSELGRLPWEQVADAIKTFAVAKLSLNEYEYVSELTKKTAWESNSALLFGIRRIAHEFGCSEEFAAKNLPYPEGKYGQSVEGPFEYAVKDSRLRSALATLGLELEQRFQKPLSDLYGYRENYVEGYTIWDTVEFQIRCEQILAGRNQQLTLNRSIDKLQKLGFNLAYLDHYSSSLRAQLSTFKFEFRPFLRRLEEFQEQLLSCKSIPEFEALNLKVIGSASVNLNSDLAGKDLICHSRLSVSDIEYDRIRNIKETPIPKVIAESRESWKGVAWHEYFQAVESCSIGIPLNEQTQEGLKRSFSNLFNGEEEALLIWCDFTARLCYTIEVRRVMFPQSEQGLGNRLGTVQDPLTAGVRPEIRRWVSREARRRGIRMTDVVEEALERLRQEAEQ